MSNHNKVLTMTRCSLMAVVIAILSQIMVPIGPVPFNLAVAGVFMAGLLLPPAAAAAAVGVYILLGCAGLPVFAGFMGGAGALLGPTGGFILGYLPLALFTSLGRQRGAPARAAHMLLGLACCYAAGTLWYSVSGDVPLMQSLASCVFPFVLPDCTKGVSAMLLAAALRRRGAAPFFFQL